MNLHIIPLKQITVGDNRQRRKFDDLALTQLAEDIYIRGLLHPLVIRSAENGEAVLVAGERRYRALWKLAEAGAQITCNNTSIPPGHAPCVTMGELNELEAEEAELSENIRRVDLTWQEIASAHARLHALRQKTNPTQTVKQTATEIRGEEAQGSQITQVSESIVLHRHLADPDVAKAKTRDEALKIVKKKAEAIRRSELAATFDPRATQHIVQQGDCRKLLLTLPANSIDVILTDPPYGVNADKFGDQAGTGHEYSDTREEALALLEHFIEATPKFCKPQSHAYVFCDLTLFQSLSASFALAGWWVWPRPLIWSKGGGMLPFPGLGPRYTYECILYAIRGKRPVLFDAQPDVLTFPNVQRPRHGAEKPVDLYAELLRRSANPGDTVLDPFMGSGTILPAANTFSCRAIGFELNPEYFNIALTRIAEKGDVEL